MATLSDLLRGGYTPPTESPLGDPIKEHFRTLPQQLEANQRAMDKTMGGMYQTDFLGRPNPNYYPEAMQEFTQNYMPNVMGSIQKVANPVAKALMSEFVPGVKAGEEMLVQHSLSPEKLYGAEKLGGMPVPSLAISKVNTPIKGFGDITLIGGKEMAIPSRANPIYSADAYTVTRPEIYTKADQKAKDLIQQMYSEPYGHFANDPSVVSTTHSLSQNFTKNVEDSLSGKMRWMFENGLMPDSKGFNTERELRMAARNVFDDLPESAKQGFYDWQSGQAKTIKDLGGDLTENIFQGYTNTGRERYKPATLENIVNEMKGQKAGAQNMQNAGSLRGKVTPQLKSFKDVQNARDKLVTEDEFAQVKDRLASTHDKLLGDVYKYLETKKSGVHGSDFLEDLVLGQTHKYDYSRELGKDVPQQLKDDIAEYAKALKTMPTEYFEAKPQRAVSIGEFKGALVPSDLPQKARNILEKSGIKEIYQYADEAERTRLIKKFGKEMFVGVPALPLAMPDEKKKTRQEILEQELKKRVE